MADGIVGSRQLLNVLIKGAGTGPTAVDGLQLRIDELMSATTLPEASRAKVQPWYTYDEDQKGLQKLQSPLARPLVTLLISNRIKKKFFNMDRHPTDPVFAWGWEYALQIDVWSNTPVMTAAIQDAVVRSAVALHAELWVQFRIGLQIESFEDAPYEIDQAIYRVLGRGTITAADTVPQPS